MPERDTIEDDIVLETPRPQNGYSAIDRLLAKVKQDHPGQWAKIRRYEQRRSAYAIRRSINQNRRGWEAEVRKNDDGCYWLYVNYVGMTTTTGQTWRESDH